MAESPITPGMFAERAVQVREDQSARHLGSGSLRVFATPAMILLIEETSREAIEPSLAAGLTTVGVELHVRHLAPTPIGSTVRIRSEVVAVDGNRVMLRAQVWDEVEQVGEAEHTRAIIDLERFQRRVAAKSSLDRSAT
jgi:fluoroacetyl-CoA thioesterase